MGDGESGEDGRVERVEGGSEEKGEEEGAKRELGSPLEFYYFTNFFLNGLYTVHSLTSENPEVRECRSTLTECGVRSRSQQ